MKRFSLKIIWLTILMLLACLALVVCVMKGFYVSSMRMVSHIIFREKRFIGPVSPSFCKVQNE